MSSGKKLLIFDMDGVVLDSEPLHKQAREIMIDKYHVTGIEDLLDVVGRPIDEFWMAVKERNHVEPGPKELEQEHYHLVARLVGENEDLESKGLRQVLRWAKERKMKIGLASSSLRILVDETLRLLELTGCFDITVAGDEVAHKKPFGDIYEKVLALAGCRPQEAMAVEDSSAGVEAAHRAGVFCFGYHNATSGNQNLSHADVIIERLEDVIEEAESRKKVR